MIKLTGTIAVMFMMATGTAFAQQAKPAGENGAARSNEFQRRVCEMRTQYREDRTDDPECKNIPPSYEVLQLLHQACKQMTEKILCKNLLPLSMASANDDAFTFFMPVETTKKEAWAFFLWSMDLLNAGPAEKNPFSAKTQERISWLFEQNKADLLTFKVMPSIATRDIKEYSLVVVTSGYKDGKALVEVNLGVLASWFWESYQLKTPVSRENRNNLVVGISHEVIHLNHGSAALQAANSDLKIRMEEEKKTWAANILEDIRPLQAKGEPVLLYWAKASAALLSCNDNPDCPAFAKFIEEITFK